MKINSLELKNFKSAPDMSIKMDSRPTFLLANNGRGKTSILNAFRYLMTGNLPDDPIQHGTPYLHVAGVIEDGQGTKIDRYAFLPSTYQINDVEYKEKAFRQEIYKLHALYAGQNTQITVTDPSNDSFRHAASDSIWKFLETGKVEGMKLNGIKNLSVVMPDGTKVYALQSKSSQCYIDGRQATQKSVKELFGNRMQGNPQAFDIVTSSEILTAMQMPDFSRYLISILPVQVDFDTLAKSTALTAEEQDVLRPMFPLAPNPISVDDVNNVYKTLYRMRTEISREKDEWAKKSIYQGQILPYDSAVYQRYLDEANKALGAAKQIENAWSVYNTRMAERKNSIETYRKWVSEYNAMSNVSQPNGELESLQKQENSLRSMLDTESRQIAALQQANGPLETMLSNLHSTVCPLCDRLVCNTDKSAVTKDLQEAVANNKRLINEANARITKYTEQLADICRKEDEARNKIKAYQAKVDLYTRLTNLKATIPAEPEKPQPRQDVSKLEAAVNDYTNKLRMAHAYEESLKAKEKYQEVAKKHALYNSLVHKTEPRKGALTNAIISILLEPFKEHVTEFSKSIVDDVELSFEMGEDGNGLQVLCKPHGRDCFLQINALSNGERMLATLALMDLISNISNARTLVFDNLETLDDQMIQSLLNMLTSNDAASQYDNILISAVAHDSIADIVSKFGNKINVISF